ncbi:FadR/GntR family transcriptional regulator [Nakamurella lactea]|uniref:FadR/GntR family transcriptional regulator n=1 Tax=Nakamurella lactea TaxID=459515 RepID=UPI00041666BA|nr:FCD domain-containing protein [Nakamurella lactea]
MRQPRLAEMVASRLREDILSGRLKEGDRIPTQAELFQEFKVSLPALREAMRILETDGLITVQRGNVGGAVVFAPSPKRAAQMIAMVLQSRKTSPLAVSEAINHLEPICAGMCAAREDRADVVVPELRRLVAVQRAALEDTDGYLAAVRYFHAAVVGRCGNEALIVVISSLQAIWAAHESMVWADPADADVPRGTQRLEPKRRREALRAHEKLVEAIEAGNVDRARRLTATHLNASHHNTIGAGGSVLASLVAGPH